MTLSRILKNVWFHVPKKRKIQFSILLLLSILSAFAEVVSIGAIVPFLSVLTSPDILYENKVSKLFIDLLGINNSDDLAYFITGFFVFAAITAGTLILLLWLLTRVSFYTGSDLGYKMFRTSIYQPYSFHINKNSSEIISNITIKASQLINGALLPLIQIFSSLIISLFVLSALIFIDPFISLICLFGLGSIYMVVILFTKNKLLNLSIIVANKADKIIKTLQEGLGGMRDIILDGTQETYANLFRQSDFPNAKAQGMNIFIAQSPRFIMEAFGMSAIAIIAVFMTQGSTGINELIPTLGAMALGAQRLLPSMQNSYSSWSVMQGNKKSLQDVLAILNMPLEFENQNINHKPLNFYKNIFIENLSFKYANNSPVVLKDININIKKGENIGLVGETGSGKSTLIDILMGLLNYYISH